MQIGYKHSEETRKKLREASFTRDNAPRLAAIPKRENHWNWQEKPSRTALHKRLHRWKGKASEHDCADCGKKARDWSSDTEDYKNLDEFKPRCRSCHVKKDKNWIKR